MPEYNDFEPLLLIDFDGERHGFAHNGRAYVDGVEFGEATFDLSLPGYGIDFMATGGGGVTGGGFSIDVDADLVWPLYQKGVRIQKSAATLYAWRGETDLSRTKVLFTGEVNSATFDFNARICSMDVAQPSRISDAVFPPGIIGAATFPDPSTDSGSAAADSALGQVYPVIYGACSGIPLHSVGAGAAPGSAKLLIAGHRIESSSIEVFDKDGVNLGPATVAEDVDALGQRYSYVEWPGWLADENYSGGDLGDPIIGKPVGAGLGDVLIDLWRSYGETPLLALDMSRVREAQPKLNRYTVSAFFNSRTEGQTLLQILESRFANQFPVAFGYIGGKFGWTALEEDRNPRIAMTLRYGHNIHGRGDVSLTDVTAIRNRFTASYNLDGYQGQDTGTFVLTADNSGVCRGSESRWGPSPFDDWQLSDVADKGTAYAVLETHAGRLKTVRQRVTYSNAPVDVLDLPLLSVLSVTDNDVGWDNKMFYLENVSPQSDGSIAVGLISV